jgi:hypothetical protein
MTIDDRETAGARAQAWEIQVADAHDRPRAVRVRVSDGRVAIGTPPGEGFSLDPEQCERMAAALRVAGERARAQRR